MHQVDDGADIGRINSGTRELRGRGGANEACAGAAGEGVDDRLTVPSSSKVWLPD